MAYGSTSKELLNNRRDARFYRSYDSYECGLLLDGRAVKLILNRRVSLGGCYGWIRRNELWLKGLIPDTEIKLLLNRHELDRIIREVREKKYLMIPESLYLRNHRIKLRLMLAKRLSHTGKEKLETIKRRDERRLKRNSDPYG